MGNYLILSSGKRVGSLLNKLCCGTAVQHQGCECVCATLTGAPSAVTTAAAARSTRRVIYRQLLTYCQ